MFGRVTHTAASNPEWLYGICPGTVVVVGYADAAHSARMPEDAAWLRCETCAGGLVLEH